MFTTAGSFAATLSYSHLKSIEVTPVGHHSLSQLQSSDPIHIRGNSDFALFGATGVGTRSDPYRFENLAITSNTTSFIVEDTTAHFVISNCRLETDGIFGGIIFQNVENGKVSNCEIVNTASGIIVDDSLDVVIENTTIYSSDSGIALNGVLNATISGCTTFYNFRGIVLDYTNRSQIRDNTIYANWQYGVQIGFSSHNNSIYGNSIGWNDMASQIRYNALDTGEDNYFDDNISIGNYWSDFNETESYVIPGTANSIDSFAQLLEDDVTPVIVPNYDTAINVDIVGNTLTWLAYDVFPKNYMILENNLERVISVWTGGEVSYGLDHLEIGSYSIAVIVTDGAGNEAIDEIIVSVVSFILGGIGTLEVMIASGITVASFVIVVILSKRLS
jgi:parallel beta-helix repeat protein